MMKFTMNAKELKTMMEKGMSAINKKAALSTLTKLYFQVEADGTVKIWGTDMEHYKCVSVFKKIMDKKSEKEVVISQDKKYIKIEGNDFTYMIRRIEGEYFKVDQLLKFSEEYRFVANRKNILEVMKYDAELVKLDNADRKPIVLHSENGNLYSYIRTAKYEAFEEVETTENNMNEELYIGFNPQFLADVFDIVDSENPVCIGTNAISPMIITGNEYKFLVLPVNIANIDYDYREKFTEHISRSKAA